jgi:hypothetical protein
MRQAVDGVEKDPAVTEDLVKIGDFRFVPEAEAARLRLAEAGVQAFLSNAELVNADWFYGNATGWVKILVPRDQVDAARAVLDALHDENRDRGSGASPDAAPCLACGAALPAGGSRCAACGWTYANADQAEGRVGGQNSRSPAAPPATPALDEDAAEQAETAATNARLIWGLIVGGVAAAALLPALRDIIQRKLG